MRVETISIPVAQPGIELRVRLEVQGKNISTSGTMFRVDAFRKHVECLPRTYPNKLTPPGPPALGMDCGTLERPEESPILHMKYQLLVPYSPSPHQPVKSVLEVLYPVSLLGST